MAFYELCVFDHNCLHFNIRLTSSTLKNKMYVEAILYKSHFFVKSLVSNTKWTEKIEIADINDYHK